MNERTVRLHDGGRFDVRAMEPADAEVVLAGFSRLSPASLRSRFFSPVPRLTPEIAHDLVQVDHHRRIVLLAFASDGQLAGEARAIRSDGDPACAELAITVSDAFQRRGIGTRLLQELARAARAAGVQELTGYVLVDNAAARALLLRHGAMCHVDEPGVLGFAIPLDTRMARTHSPTPVPLAS